MDITALAHCWAAHELWHPVPLAKGTNNLVLRVDDAHVLHVYLNHADARRLELEQRVLARLMAAGLPFALPLPIPTAGGDLYARVATHGGEALAVLTAFIPGEHPDRADPSQAVAAGEALGLLDVALARIELTDDDAAVS